MHLPGWLVVVVGSAIAIAAAWVQRAVGRALRRRAGGRRLARAAEGERAAARLLERRGYRVTARQAVGRWSMAVDGETLELAVRADYLVERSGRTLVAEVKTGQVAPRADHPATRRQLLEYRHAFGADGVLLVDAEGERVREVRFPVAAGPGLRWLLTGLTVGAAAGAMAARLLG